MKFIFDPCDDFSIPLIIVDEESTLKKISRNNSNKYSFEADGLFLEEDRWNDKVYEWWKSSLA